MQIGFTFLVPAHPGSPGKRAVCEVFIYKMPLSEKLRTLMYEKPLSTDKGLASCMRPLSGKSTGISEDSAKESTEVFVMFCQTLWKSLNSEQWRIHGGWGQRGRRPRKTARKKYIFERN